MRDPSRPNWRQVQKAKAEAAAKDLKKSARAEDMFANIRLARRMFEAGWAGCESGDDFTTAYWTALRREGLYDSALSAASRSYLAQDRSE